MRFLYTHHKPKKIVAVEFEQAPSEPPGSGSNILTLECGHKVRQKASIRVYRRKICPICNPYL